MLRLQVCAITNSHRWNFVPKKSPQIKTSILRFTEFYRTVKEMMGPTAILAPWKAEIRSIAV
jgi:hypothetical protein